MGTDIAFVETMVLVCNKGFNMSSCRNMYD